MTGGTIPTGGPGTCESVGPLASCGSSLLRILRESRVLLNVFISG